MSPFLLLVAGFALLIGGGDLLVRGAVGVARRLGVTPLVIGLTLVAFGTSAPELVTSVQAALAGSPGIAVGNIVGSNIANILLILGVTALVAPVAVHSRALKRDGGFVLAITACFVVLALVWPLDRLAGAVFFVLLAGYLVFTFRQERIAAHGHGAVYDKAEAARGADPALEPAGRLPGGLWLPLALAVGGLVLVVLGGRLLVDGAVTLARIYGISETVIGLTVIAIGTSLPELATSLIAALRGESEVAFGNIVGSNIYNLLFIGGATGLVAPLDVPGEIARFDAPVMLGVTVVMVVMAWTGLRVGRREGGALLAGYVAYAAWLWAA